MEFHLIIRSIVHKIKLSNFDSCYTEVLSGVHNVFHVSNLRKCLVDETHHVPMDEIQVNEQLNFVEKPIEIVDRMTRKLKKTYYAIVKVRWSSRRGPEFTWEREDQMKKKYPQLFETAAYRRISGRTSFKGVRM